VNDLTIEQILLLLAPIVLIQLGLMIAALVDLERDERRVRGGSKIVWALIIVFVNIIGPILYFVVGREEA
jgi:Phospholipase_D-nuclease N-terminal